MTRRLQKSAFAVVLCGLLAPCRAQESDELTEKSFPLRTALYHDPTLGPPLDRLLELFGSENRTPELVGLYRQHVSQYPEDAGALTVLVRLLSATGDPEATAVARQAAERFPESAFIQHLLFEQLRKTREPGALDALDRALAAETSPNRKKLWIDELLPLAAAAGRPDLARQHLEGLAAESPTAAGKLEAARKMLAQRFYAPALEVVEAARQLAPSAELGVDLDLAAASAEIGLDRHEAAAGRLDRVLARLAPDYWRRAEILHRRAALVKSDAERDAMLDAARARLRTAPGDESAVLEAAQLLSAFEFPREALNVLTTAAQKIPGSEKIEKSALELFDRLRDERGREVFLAERLKVAPERNDLALMRVRTLHLLGRHGEATELFRAAAANLDPDTRLTQGMEVARFLRRSSLPADAAGVLEGVVALAPGRLDLRRELAETLLAAGDKDRARALFRQQLPADAEMENVIDVVQFLLKEKMLEEARAEVVRRLATDPQNFDLGLLDLQIAGKLADRARGQERLAALRALADTTARYRRWLEAAVDFHGSFETTADFLAGEKARLLAGPGGWAGESRERRLAWAEVAASNDGKDGVAELFGEALEGELSTEMRIELRRRQLALVENDPARIGEVEKQLEALLEDDPGHAGEYRLRLALLYAKMERSDRVMNVLQAHGNALSKIDPQKIDNPGLLTAFEALVQRFGGGMQPDVQYRLVQRLLELEPSNRSTWERWITLQAVRGDEEGLRTSLRRLLAGMDKMPVPEEVRPLLQTHLLASSWRSIHRLLDEAGEKNGAQLSQVLSQLEEAERAVQSGAQSQWIIWTRAYVLNRLDRREARDAAIAELEGKDAEGKDGIAFPDGFVIGMAEARELLTQLPSLGSRAAPASGEGPRGELKVRWAFDTDSGAGVTKILPLENHRVLVVDDTGRMSALDAGTGKFLWSEMSAPPLLPKLGQARDYGGLAAMASRPEPVCDGDRIVYPTEESIECRSTEDGRLLWHAPLFARVDVLPSLFFRGDAVLVCDPANSRVSSFDLANGKLRWQREYSAERPAVPLLAVNSGASLSGDRLFIYGAGVWIVSAEDGSVQWAFDASRAAEFPVELAPATPATFSALSGTPPARRRNQMMMDYLRGPNGRGLSSRGFDPRGGMMFVPSQASLVLNSPMGSWASLNSSGYNPYRIGVLDGSRLLLIDGQGSRLLRLDYPFSSRQFASMGAFVGSSGSKLIFLQPGLLSIGDLESPGPAVGEMSVRISLPPPPGSNPGRPDPAAAQVDAVVSGVLVYVGNWEGVACYQAITGEMIWKTPWPASVRPESIDTAQLSDEARAQQQADYYGRGRMPGMMDSVAVVHDGVLYVRAGNSRVVALAGKEEAAP